MNLLTYEIFEKKLSDHFYYATVYINLIVSSEMIVSLLRFGINFGSALKIIEML